jgi:methyl-accepting chemotaxis protein
MVEQSNAASNTLANEAVRLRDLVVRFRLAGAGPTASARPAYGTESAHASPARGLNRKVGTAFSGNTALAAKTEWQEF